MNALPPPRPRLPSSPEGWAQLADLRAELGALQGQLAELKLTLVSQGAAMRHQTLQLLIGGVVTCVAAVGGSRVVAPKPEPSTTVIQRSALDRALDACRALQDAPTQGACIARVVSDSMGVR